MVEATWPQELSRGDTWAKVGRPADDLEQIDTG